ncbi:hypothetical protein TRFO_10635 [Tritrichomonas foetus]|uniref:Intimal thickness related receptor IRP domain-containing protein n=1 Tax=Tritrichomonas foetus TaxID=1144522 RepID=A0A1J4JD05_9EUKA|nr:hypothetical protein TRFO_10635 [Tritrichomonas foetus]|eukprot:OHS95156.1 hypothetical protein TRFO_10635 [Tritrichomonas foetus]
MLFWVFQILSHSYVQSMRFNSVDRIIKLHRFGFSDNSSYNFSINNTNLKEIKIFLIKNFNSRKLPQLENICNSKNNYFEYDSNQQISPLVKKSEFIWEGNVTHAGFYTPIIINCEKSLNSKFDIFYQFKNQDSLLDTRDEICPMIHIFLLFLYMIVFLVWLANGLSHTSFRIPIHTLFCIQPIFKMISLKFLLDLWITKRVTESPPFWKEIVVHVCDFLNYSLLVSVITYAGAGICIYRNRFTIQDHFEIICSSSLLTVCLILIPFINSVKSIMFVLIITCIGLFWHLKLNVISLIISSRILEQMKGQPIVHSKINLSRAFVKSSILCLLFTLLGYVLTSSSYFSDSTSIITMETGLFIESILNLRFFLFRKIYAGEQNTEGKVIQIKRVVNVKQLITPIGSYIALLERYQY